MYLPLEVFLRLSLSREESRGRKNPFIYTHWETWGLNVLTTHRRLGLEYPHVLGAGEIPESLFSTGMQARQHWYP